jgi:hypothetical protein
VTFSFNGFATPTCGGGGGTYLFVSSQAASKPAAAKANQTGFRKICMRTEPFREAAILASAKRPLRQSHPRSRAHGAGTACRGGVMRRKTKPAPVGAGSE